jgi:hypothetical protein
MKIKMITSRHGNDFCAILKCEYCGCTQEQRGTSEEKYLNQTAMPAIVCQMCGKTTLTT